MEIKVSSIVSSLDPWSYIRCSVFLSFFEILLCFLVGNLLFGFHFPVPGLLPPASSQSSSSFLTISSIFFLRSASSPGAGNEKTCRLTTKVENLHAYFHSLFSQSKFSSNTRFSLFEKIGFFKEEALCYSVQLTCSASAKCLLWMQISSKTNDTHLPCPP